MCSAPRVLAELPVSTPSQKEEAEGEEEEATMASPSLNPYPVQELIPRSLLISEAQNQ
jgi:hypothetical protein